MTYSCPRIGVVTEAIRRGTWSDEVVTHIDVCDECAAAVFDLGVALLDEEPTGGAWVDPVVLWWTGRALARARAIERAARLPLIVHLAALVLASVVATLAAAWTVLSIPSLQSTLAELAPWFAAAAVIMLLAALMALGRSGATIVRKRHQG